MRRRKSGKPVLLELYINRGSGSPRVSDLGGLQGSLQVLGSTGVVTGRGVEVDRTEGREGQREGVKRDMKSLTRRLVGEHDFRIRVSDKGRLGWVSLSPKIRQVG